MRSLVRSAMVRPTYALALLGQTIRELRIDKGMTQQQVADRAGVNRTFIVALEKGRQNASTITLVKIARALDALPSDLFRRFTKGEMRSLAED